VPDRVNRKITGKIKRLGEGYAIPALPRRRAGMLNTISICGDIVQRKN
jgi:hypothetical protein